MMDDGPSTAVNRIVKANAIKRPRVLDMNKIRSVVLGGGGGGGGTIIETSTKEEQFSETFLVKPTSDNLSGWKKFATYDAYLASKRPAGENDEIILEELVESGWYRKVAQAFGVLLPVASVGVMGDGRTYAGQSVIAVRAVETTDFMTADWSHLDPTVLAKISSRIVNEVKGINRVVYDISSKPPATIEWE